MTVFQRSLHDALGRMPRTVRSLSFTDLVLSSPTHPHTLSPWNKTGDINVGAELLTGTTGVQVVLPNPSEPPDERHIAANAIAVVLSGKWDRDKTLCAISPSLRTPAPLASWVDSGEESFYSGWPPSFVPTCVSYYGRQINPVRWCVVVMISSRVQEEKPANCDTTSLAEGCTHIFWRSPESRKIIYS